MSDRQLQDAARRLAEPIVPTQGPEEARPLHVAPDELETFRAFVAAELAFRHQR